MEAFCNSPVRSAIFGELEPHQNLAEVLGFEPEHDLKLFFKVQMEPNG